MPLSSFLDSQYDRRYKDQLNGNGVFSFDELDALPTISRPESIDIERLARTITRYYQDGRQSEREFKRAVEAWLDLPRDVRGRIFGHVNIDDLGERLLALEKKATEKPEHFKPDLSLVLFLH